MISRVFVPGGSFRVTCQYVAQDISRAEVLYQQGVRGHDHELMARDFELVASLHPTIGKPVFHGTLTFHPDEKVNQCKMVNLAQEWLDGIGLKDMQIVVVQHRDARHQHVHVVANRIGYDGKEIHCFPEILRSRDTVQRLNREYGLKQVGPKDLRQTNFDALDASDTRRYAVYRSVRNYLPQVSDVNELAEKLRMEGIETRFRENEAGQRMGISFYYQGEAFRGSEIDREFSIRGLEHHLAQRQGLGQWAAKKCELARNIEREEARQALRLQEELLRERQAMILEEEAEVLCRAHERPRMRLRIG